MTTKEVIAQGGIEKIGLKGSFLKLTLLLANFPCFHNTLIGLATAPPKCPECKSRFGPVTSISQ